MRSSLVCKTATSTRESSASSTPGKSVTCTSTSTLARCASPSLRSSTRATVPGGQDAMPWLRQPPAQLVPYGHLPVQGDSGRGRRADRARRARGHAGPPAVGRSRHWSHGADGGGRHRLASLARLDPGGDRAEHLCCKEVDGIVASAVARFLLRRMRVEAHAMALGRPMQPANRSTRRSSASSAPPAASTAESTRGSPCCSISEVSISIQRRHQLPIRLPDAPRL